MKEQNVKYQLYYEMQEYLKKLTKIQKETNSFSSLVQDEIDRIQTILDKAIEETKAEIIGKRSFIMVLLTTEKVL